MTKYLRIFFRQGSEENKEKLTLKVFQGPVTMSLCIRSTNLCWDYFLV